MMRAYCSSLAYKLWWKGCESAGYYKNLVTASYRYDFTMEFIRKLLKKEDTILDVGTGTGTMPFLLAMFNEHNNIKIKGIDVTELSLANRILKFFPEYGGIIQFEKRSVFDIDEKADVVICTEVIEHLKEEKKAFENLFNAAKRLLLITVPSEHSSDNVPGHLRRYTKEDIDKLVSPFTKEYEVKSHELVNHFHFVIINKGGVNDG